MSFFRKLFGKEEPFVPTPTQSVPGLEPIVVQAVEKLFPNRDDQNHVFKYSLEYKKIQKGDTLRLLLSLLAYSKGKRENLVDPELWTSYHFMVDEISPIFRNTKAAEKWVKSISESQD